jgi:hypothetical protein
LCSPRGFVSKAFSTGKRGAIAAFFDLSPKLNRMMSQTSGSEEHGMTNLKGKTNSKRALALIELAAPQFRERLLTSAKVMGIIR